ncbi:hypothetical protein NA57DRAFT_67641 [Rhizodiscina lignyota]|uniref:Secreted protein n=1 Tax=Rhizodiscina lignyota TaxID=1504668 RepID=A0A9P4M3S2_9PEZI|nr:hypothetical protein NA57DRAFT_67641 [Rhizodiscina lignyota]
MWSTVTGLPENHTDALVNAAIDAGTFQNPSAKIRPRYRYWVPDASVSHASLAEDVKEAGEVGAGGVEVLGYYLYGGTFAPDDWSIYGWGTPAWQQAFNALAQAHVDNGLIMDFAMGPNQGQGVPAPENSEGLMWDLYSYNVSIPTGGSFSGKIPGWSDWPAGSLQAVIAGTVVSSVNVTVPNSPPSLNATGVAPGLPGDSPHNRTQVTLAADSLQDLTSRVTANGTLNVNFQANSTGLEINLFFVYLIHNGYRAQQDPAFLQGPQTTPQTWLQNGSWSVDHFSATGAKTITDFWEKYVLTNGTKELVMQVGNYGWEDSIETRGNVFWTRDFPSVFAAQHNYDVTKWLPILFHENKIGFDSEPPIWWITDESDAGDGHIADYRQTLTDLYGVYVETLNNWAHEYLDIQYSAQISYNLPMDMLQNVPNVDAPECESLGFNHLIDGYRQYTGPSNLAGKRIISTECGANHLEAYEQTMPELLWDVKRSIAGSVNQFVFHGYPYSGPYGNTTWPGFTTFDYQYSEMHGKRQPSWNFASDTIDFAARLQFVFQSGIPKLDVALYMKITNFPSIVRNYQPTDLEKAGYGYEYLSPDNFNLPEAYVSKGILAPERQAFKALVVRANDSMTPNGVQQLAEYAHAGLPILFSGGFPTYLLTAETVQDNLISDVLRPLASLPNVHVIPYEGLAASLASIGVTPLTKLSANTTWYTYWRRDDLKGMDYVFVYNDGGNLGLGNGYSEGTVQFDSTGVPYTFDAWTGEQKPILNYSQTDTSTTIFFQLAGNQSTIVAFADSPLSDSPVPTTHATSADAGILGLSSADGKLVAIAGPGSSSMSVTTSEGKVHSVAGAAQSTLALSNWTLVAESWTPSSDIFDIEKTSKTNTTHHLDTLTSWQNINGLQNVSGLGYYSTSFTWSAGSSYSNSSSSTGAFIDFGAIVHTIRVTINGHTLPPLDLNWAKADVSQYLIEGENTVEAVVSTPLLNVLRVYWDKLLSSGAPPPTPPAPAQDYGLIQPVRIIPYRATVLG